MRVNAKGMKPTFGRAHIAVATGGIDTTDAVFAGLTKFPESIHRSGLVFAAFAGEAFGSTELIAAAIPSARASGMYWRCGGG